MTITLAVVATVAAAACFGSTGAMQHEATQRAGTTSTFGVRLVLQLLHQRLWVVAIVINVAGIGLQFLALRLGPLLLVQPLLSTSLLFAVVTGALLQRHRTDEVVVVGVVLTVLGLTGFLLSAAPSAGSARTGGRGAVVLVVVLTGVVVACLVGAHVVDGITRSLLLALACGVLYGVTAGLIKTVVDETSRGILEPLGHWPLWAVAVVGPLGFLLNQGAFRAEPIVAPALAVITTVDPVVGIFIGLVWLQESIRTSPLALAGEVVSLLVLAAGITALALRAPHSGGQHGDRRPERVGA